MVTKQGQITLIYGKKKKYAKEVIITIEHTGSGIDPDLIARLFTKFATKSHTRTGLDFFIGRSIVETHGGEIVLPVLALPPVSPYL